MSSFLLKHYRVFYLLLPVLLGLALGHLAATALGIYLSPPALAPGEKVETRAAATRPPSLPEFQVVLERNIFDSTAQVAGNLTEAENAPEVVSAAPAVRTDLTLFGTITRGADSLAVIKAGQKVKTYHLGDEVPGGGKIEMIDRHSVSIRNPNGSLQVLPLYAEKQPKESPISASASPAGGDSAGGAEIHSVGENRWVIPQTVAEQARGNIGELLKQARVEPNMINGKTEGFVVRMIRPRSILANLGIQRGDILMQVNGVELNGPEKALQIFQQLREAKNISIGLLRNGNNLSFEYEVN
ncbi:MAG: type II secretion system protein GspC [Desulfuromonadales bacterium]